MDRVATEATRTRPLPRRNSQLTTTKSRTPSPGPSQPLWQCADLADQLDSVALCRRARKVLSPPSPPSNTTQDSPEDRCKPGSGRFVEAHLRRRRLKPPLVADSTMESQFSRTCP